MNLALRNKLTIALEAAERPTASDLALTLGEDVRRVSSELLSMQNDGLVTCWRYSRQPWRWTLAGPSGEQKEGT